METDTGLMAPADYPSEALPPEWRMARDRMRTYLAAMNLSSRDAEDLIAGAVREAGRLPAGDRHPVAESMRILRQLLKERGIIDDAGRVADILPVAAAPEWNRGTMLPQDLDPPWNGEVARAFTRIPFKGLGPFAAMIAILIYIFLMF